MPVPPMPELWRASAQGRTPAAAAQNKPETKTPRFELGGAAF